MQNMKPSRPSSSAKLPTRSLATEGRKPGPGSALGHAGSTRDSSRGNRIAPRARSRGQGSRNERAHLHAPLGLTTLLVGLTTLSCTIEHRLEQTAPAPELEIPGSGGMLVGPAESTGGAGIGLDSSGGGATGGIGVGGAAAPHEGSAGAAGSIES